MSDHDCVRCIQCDSCPVCAADALYREVDENDRLRERLDQFDAHGFPNVAAALDRVNAAEARAARYEAALREIAAIPNDIDSGPDWDPIGEIRLLARAALAWQEVK